MNYLEDSRLLPLFSGERQSLDMRCRETVTWDSDSQAALN